MEYGLAEARKLLLYLNEQGIGVATEFLDPITPPYLSDLISWTAIGARTTESQTHRNMASGLSMPVGFKNSTLGDLDIAVNAILSAGIGHAFLGVDHNGRVSKVTTLGNSNCHLVLRGGFNGANYSPAQIAAAQKALLSKGLLENVLVDCSHGNSQKDFRKQPAVFLDVLMQSRKNHGIIGLMIESNINEGQQRPPGDGRYRTDLEYGVSITDGCIGFGEARGLLRAASA